MTCLDVSCEPLQRAHGSGRVVVGAGRNGRASLTELYQEGSAKIRLPNTHDGHVQAVFLNTAGGLTGGDALCWQAKVGANAHLELTTPACERIYKTTGEPATIATRLQAGEGAILEWLPQETLLFAQSRLERCLEVDLQAGSRFLALEAVVLGRPAHGDDGQDARLSDSWRIRREGRLVHAENLCLSGSAMERNNPALLDGKNAFATLVLIGGDLEAKAAGLPAPTGPDARMCFGVIGEKLVVRFLAAGSLALRKILVPAIRHLTMGRSVPALWST